MMIEQNCHIPRATHRRHGTLEVRHGVFNLSEVLYNPLALNHLISMKNSAEFQTIYNKVNKETPL